MVEVTGVEGKGHKKNSRNKTGVEKIKDNARRQLNHHLNSKKSE